MVFLEKKEEKRDLWENLLRFPRFFVILQEFAGFLYIKAVWGNKEKWGYDLDTVLNSTFCYKSLSMNS